MNVYIVSCLEYGDMSNVFSNPEKATNYLCLAYSGKANLIDSKAVMARNLRIKGSVSFSLLESESETVKIDKVKVA